MPSLATKTPSASDSSPPRSISTTAIRSRRARRSLSIAEAGIDHLCVGDHVSFFVGAGSDGLITATALLAAQAELPVYVALYLLPLRHPVTGRPAARNDRGAGPGPADARRRDRRRGPPRDRDLRRRPQDARAADGRMPADPARARRRHAGHVRRRVLLAQGRAHPAGAVAADTADRRRTVGRGGRAAPRSSATAGSGSGSRPADTPR